MELSTLLENIKRRADQLQRGGMDIDAAYQMALVQIFKAASETQAVSPFEERILNIVDDLSSSGLRPVRTGRLSVELGGMSAWSLWNHLSKLRARGLVQNVGKAGWLVTQPGADKQ
jgi:biotin operon repressor